VRHKVAVLLLLILTSAASGSAGLRPWTEVRSPHFVVFTDGSAGDGRRVAREFEQMRGVFAAGHVKIIPIVGIQSLATFADSEGTSAKVAHELRKQGYQPLVIRGGLRSWKKAGLPIEPVPAEDIKLPIRIETGIKEVLLQRPASAAGQQPVGTVPAQASARILTIRTCRGKQT